MIGDSDDEVATEAVKKQDGREEKEDTNTPHHESDAEMARRLQMEELASHRADRKRKSETEEDDDASKHKRTATDQRAAGFAGATPPKFIADGVGFRLLFTQSIPMKWNENCVRLKDVIAGEIQWAVLTNYMFDMEWLLSDIPQLLSIPKVAILHHAKQVRPKRASPTCLFAILQILSCSCAILRILFYVDTCGFRPPPPSSTLPRSHRTSSATLLLLRSRSPSSSHFVRSALCLCF